MTFFRVPYGVEDEVVEYGCNQYGVEFFTTDVFMEFNDQLQTFGVGFTSPDGFVFFDDFGDFGNFLGVLIILADQIQEYADYFFHSRGRSLGSRYDLPFMIVQVFGIAQKLDGGTHDSQRSTQFVAYFGGELSFAHQ